MTDNTPFLPMDEYFAERKKALPEISYNDVWQMIHRGSMPKLCENPDFDWQMFYGADVRIYIERDVDVSQPTSERWLSILVASNIVYLSRPYSNNVTKRDIDATMIL